MYLTRKIDLFLKEWKEDSNRKPLIVKGARQIGKTESIRKFIDKAYSNVIYINFIEEPVYKNILVDGFSVESVIKNITMIDPSKKFVKNDTVIFFDEIQDYPDIATTLKFFKIDGSYDVICSGSLLGLNYNEIESNSVGYKTDYIMNSLDFEEFLWAKGYDNSNVEDIINHMINIKPFNELELKIYDELFLEYSILGGMPEVVKQYIESGSFENTLALQRQLLLDYEEDIKKYLTGLDQTRVLNTFKSVVPQLAKENKKFQISKIEKNARMKDYRGCIEWLSNAGLVNICYNLSYPELPLKGNYDIDKFKLYLFDTGILVAMLDDETQMDLRGNKNLGIYKGALYENIVAESLAKQGYDLFYYKKESSTLEEDFFIRDIKNIIPVEVKATNGTSKSLNTLIKDEKYQDIKYGIKLIKGNIGFNGSIYTFPYFCSFVLRRYLEKVNSI